MVVVLQNHLAAVSEQFPVEPQKENFIATLRGMGVPEDRLKTMTIVIEFLNMIPDGAMVVIDDNKFGIYLRRLRVSRTLNETVAHELKHIATEVLRPKKDRKDGKKKGPYKWEEVNCERAEKRYGHLEFFIPAS